MQTEEDSKAEPSPILGSWRNVYILVVITLLVVIALLYWFTLYFR